MAESIMLRELRIRNLAVIEEVTVPFASGLNVLTGETGAGKSILVDAILLVLGARAHPDVIRSGEDLATVNETLRQIVRDRSRLDLDLLERRIRDVLEEGESGGATSG